MAFTAASLDLPLGEEALPEQDGGDERADRGHLGERDEREEREGGGGAQVAVPTQDGLWGDPFDLPAFPDNEGLTEEERRELAELEAWQRQKEEAANEQRRRLALLRQQRAQEQDQLSYPSTRQLDARVQPLGARSVASQPLGSGTATRHQPPVIELERRLNERMDMWSNTAQPASHDGFEHFASTPASGDLQDGQPLEALAAKARKTQGEEENKPLTLDKAMITMTTAVTRLASALNENKEASILKWERKKPTVKMANPEEFLSELVNLENAYAETGARTYRRRWAIFRPALEGRAKETVEVELERRGLTAHSISQFEEDDYKVLYEYLLAYLEKSVGLTTDKKAEISLQAMTRVHMQPDSGPAGAERFIADYRHAYLLELRAKLVEDSAIAATKRLYELRQKMSPELRSYIKGLPEAEQPTNLEMMYDSIRRWADKERAGQSGDAEGHGRRRRERHHEMKPAGNSSTSAASATAATTASTSTSSSSALTPDAIMSMMANGIAQALARTGAGAKGKPAAAGAKATAAPALTKCSRCKGFHCPSLPSAAVGRVPQPDLPRGRNAEGDAGDRKAVHVLGATASGWEQARVWRRRPHLGGPQGGPREVWHEHQQSEGQGQGQEQGEGEEPGRRQELRAQGDRVRRGSSCPSLLGVHGAAGAGSDTCP